MKSMELYRYYLQQLQQIYNAGEAATITERIFESTAGVTRADLMKDPALPLDVDILATLSYQLTDLLTHKPVQYVLGEAWFYNMKLQVNEHTLIPRPETEELVKLVIEELQGNGGRDMSILDIGTGSGCIAVALAKNVPAARVSALDISEAALTISAANAQSQGTTVEFFQLDFLDESSWTSLPKFNVIVSNPPYIPAIEKENLDKNVRNFEPATALFVPDQSPLLFYEKIEQFAQHHLVSGGKIFLEVHEDLAKETAILFNNKYQHVSIKKDIFGKDRMVIAF